MGRKIPTMRLSFELPPEILAVGWGMFPEGKRPKIELIVFRNGLKIGGRKNLIGENTFGSLKVRLFSPTSGCKLFTRNGKVIKAEPGLRGLIGRNFSTVNLVNHPASAVMIFWSGDMSVPIMRNTRLVNCLVRTMHSLSLAFAFA